MKGGDNMKYLLNGFMGFLAGVLLGYLLWGMPDKVGATRPPQCKHENAECEINNSNKACCEGLKCVPFNVNSGNGKCEEVTPTASPAVTPTEKPSRHHYTCKENACVKVKGEGEDTCEVDKDCEPEVTPTVTPTPTETPEVTPTPEVKVEVRGVSPASPPVCNAPAVTTAPAYNMGMMERIDPDTVKVSWVITDGHAQKYGIYYGMNPNNLTWYTEVFGHDMYEARLNQVPSGHVWVKICSIGTCGDQICGGIVDP